MTKSEQFITRCSDLELRPWADSLMCSNTCMLENCILFLEISKEYGYLFLFLFFFNPLLSIFFPHNINTYMWYFLAPLYRGLPILLSSIVAFIDASVYIFIFGFFAFPFHFLILLYVIYYLETIWLGRIIR